VVQVCALRLLPLAGGCEARAADSSTSELKLGSARLESAAVGTVVRTIERGRATTSYERGSKVAISEVVNSFVVHSFVGWFGRVCVELARLLRCGHNPRRR